MKEINGGTQMKDVWNLPAIACWEKSCGKHPTQKTFSPVSPDHFSSQRKTHGFLILLIAAAPGIAANLLNRKFLGMDKETEFLNLSKAKTRD